MSVLSSVNWAKAWRRSIWTLFFAAFLALVIFMSKDMANDQPVIFGMVILAAVVTAVAFVYASESKEALVIAVFGLCAHLFLTASYWSSTIEDINTQATRERSAAAVRDIVREKQAERYAESATTKSAAQIQAEIKAAEQHERWATTKQCTDATITESREYCQSYWLLKAELASALTAEDLESTVWKSGTTIEAAAIPRNLAKGALFIASLTGMSVESATNLLVVILVLFEQAGLAGSLRVGYRDKSTTKPLSAPEAVSAPIVASEPPKPLTTPSGPSGGTKKTGPALGDMVKSAMASSKPLPVLEKPKLAVVRDDLKTPEEIAKAWVREFAPPGTGSRVVSAKSARWHHNQWCRIANVKNLNMQQLGIAVKKAGVVIDRSSGKGSTYIFNPMEQEVEKIAAFG